MDRWEYFTTVLEANVDVAPVPIRDDLPTKDRPKYSVLTLMPQLNWYGERGWELVSMDPVIVGRNGDVVPPTQGGAYSRQYLCAFKRRRQDLNPV